MGRRGGFGSFAVRLSRAAFALDRAARPSVRSDARVGSPRRRGSQPRVYRPLGGEHVSVNGMAGTVTLSKGSESFVLWQAEPDVVPAGAWLPWRDLQVVGWAGIPVFPKGESSWVRIDASTARVGGDVRIVFSRLAAQIGLNGELLRVDGDFGYVLSDAFLATSRPFHPTRTAWIPLSDLIQLQHWTPPPWPGTWMRVHREAGAASRSPRVLVVASNEEWALISTGPAGGREVRAVRLDSLDGF